MRVLFISNLYPPQGLGGMEIRCKETVDRLRQRGHICHVLTSCHGVEGQAQSDKDVSRTLYLEADVDHYRPLDFFVRRPWREVANCRTLWRTLDTFKPDIVFIWGMWNLSPRVACWAERWMPGRVAYNIGSYWPLDIDPHTAYWRKPAQHLLARVLLWPAAQLALSILRIERYPPLPNLHHVSCCSRYVADKLTNAGVLPAAAMVILNGIDPRPFTADQRQAGEQDGLMRLLYFGSLVKQKGVHTAIEALGLLRERGQADGMCLTIVGGGQPDYETHLRLLTQSLQLEGKVHFVGRVPRSEIPVILGRHDVFLFTSIWDEPFGRTILEAMAAGLPVIGAEVGGSREVFQFYPENLFFAPGDAEALADQIQRLADHPDLARRVVEVGRTVVLEHFTLGRMVDEMEAWLCSFV